MARSETAPRLDEALIDEALARLESLGGVHLVERMIEAFLQNAARTVDAAGAAFEARDARGVERAAHSLKSSAANLGAAGLRELAQSVESLAPAESRSPDGSTRLAELVAALPGALGDVRRYLRARKLEA